MVRIGFDTNILVYAELEPRSDKGRSARRLIAGAARRGIIPVQVYGEFLNVVLRKKPDALPEALRQAADYRAAMTSPATTLDVVLAASALAIERRMQFWDCAICVTSALAGATILFSEDMQDGAEIRGLRIVNPFDSRNDATVERMLSN